MGRGMAQGERLAKFRRVTELFQEGREVVLDANPEDPVLVWVNKINPFEMEEARRDGNVGRARAQIRIDDQDSDEHDVFLQAMEGPDRDQVQRALLGAKSNEHYVGALDDIRADPDWINKLAALERGDAQLDDAGVELDDDERSRLSKLNQEYMVEVQRLMDIRVNAYRSELTAMEDAEVRALYRDVYRDSAGTNGFLTEYRTTEMYFALRDCEAKAKDDGWDHGGCDHNERLCVERSAVRSLPEGLITKVREAMLLLNMSPRDAGNSDAPASSSASSERPNAAAGSTPSTPAET